jgi:hypothetical protein
MTKINFSIAIDEKFREREADAKKASHVGWGWLCGARD